VSWQERFDTIPQRIVQQRDGQTGSRLRRDGWGPGGVV